ncbi:MAG: aldo/keto reductase, partial [Chthoniobacterales bacterium]
MHYGEALDDDSFIDLIRLAHEKGIRTFVTADVYGRGEADTLLGRALKGITRDSYCLVGAVGHDFYEGEREGSKCFPRFTNSTLRKPDAFADYLRSATEKSLARCRVDRFDLLLLHNPDATGYTSDAVWKGMEKLKDVGLTNQLGIAPGPANGFTLDLILALERFQGLIDWSMIILNPLEPWPGKLCLPAAERTGAKVLTRVVDYGGLFHDDVMPGHEFAPRDHRTFRPSG